MSSSSKPLVSIRCKKCRSVLFEVMERPTRWDNSFGFLMCKCALPDPSRIVDVLFKKDLDAMPIHWTIPKEELRSEIDRALATGRTVHVVT